MRVTSSEVELKKLVYSIINGGMEEIPENLVLLISEKEMEILISNTPHPSSIPPNISEGKYRGLSILNYERLNHVIGPVVIESRFLKKEHNHPNDPFKGLIPPQQEKGEYDEKGAAVHYQDSFMESIYKIESIMGTYGALCFCEGNILKYRDRLGKKKGEDIQKELLKISWYENKSKELIDKMVTAQELSNPIWNEQISKIRNGE